VLCQGQKPNLHINFDSTQDPVLFYFFSKEVKEEKLDFHSFTKVLIVSFATSLDAFGVGIGLGISDKLLYTMTKKLLTT
jgi:putative Mn2+ efflux pump MntP